MEKGFHVFIYCLEQRLQIAILQAEISYKYNLVGKKKKMFLLFIRKMKEGVNLVQTPRLIRGVTLYKLMKSIQLFVCESKLLRFICIK